ncbi:MAG TPA: sulfatase-like hydrolase/transferase [Caulobacteraceae bacterium]|jgi:arylsulfatase A-like enzyme|nr:sulfatase-like hydrolase/transferase [Caulobacteraceae bacterium]
MKFWKWAAAAAVLVVVLLGAAWTQREAIFIAIAHARLPHVEPNHAVVWAQGPANPPAGKRAPNIVFILADDMGFNDITFNGGGVADGAVPTPNIDSIGRDGVSFASGYDGNATCAPSRAAIMTGRYATRFGFEFTPAPVAFERLVGGMHDQDDIVLPHFFPERLKDMPPGSTKGAQAVNMLAVPPSEIMIGKLLQTRGYHTLQFGKWHLGAARGTRPEERGFDESLGFMAGASMYLPEKDPDAVNSKQPWDPIDRFLWPNLPYAVQFNGSKPFAPRGYMTDYLADEAVKAIHANRNRPFFLYFAPNAIHTPLQATKADYDALPQIKDHRLRVYGAMVRALDRDVGRLLAQLKADGLDDNTLVIFTSDNGGANYIGLPQINRPYRGFKASFFEGGIHSPFFIRWPGVVAPGSRFAYPVGHVDIFATAAAAAGAALPADRKIDGVDLIPYLTGKAKGRPHQTLYWRSGQYKTLLDGDWKLQSSEAQKKLWLYDLSSDPTERHELSSQRPDKVKALLAELAAQDHEMVKPLWPSLLQGPIFIDHPSGQKQRKSDEYILWDN